MTETQLLLLRDCHDGLKSVIAGGNSMRCLTDPLITLVAPPTIQPRTGKVQFSEECIRHIQRTLALSCTYDPPKTRLDIVRHLRSVAIAIQLVKPTTCFLELWVSLNEASETERASRRVSELGHDTGPNLTLPYQRCHQIIKNDVNRAVRFLPRVERALEPSPLGSWRHPVNRVHRAIVFFCQGYTIRPTDARQFLWAAGLDCLYASKSDRKKQGRAAIARRMERLLGEQTKLYEADTVSIPKNETRPDRELREVAEDIFILRNAFAHGLDIDDPNWLSADPSKPGEPTYAYQLEELTEIALRLTLLKVLEDQNLFEIFRDPSQHDKYFA